MTSLLAVSTAADTDHLPRPSNASSRDHSVGGLPRPLPSALDVVDSGRISFGAAMRLPSVR
jgi:hypothetical protein